MPTHVEYVYTNGAIQHIDFIETGYALHAFAESPDGTVNQSLIIECSEDDLQADILMSPEPQSIIRPLDEGVVNGLLETSERIATVIRGGEKRLLMNDSDRGMYMVVIRHLVEMPPVD